MEPLVDWILAHDRGGCHAAAIRAAYEAWAGELPGTRAQQNQVWLQAFGAARREQRAAAALEGAAPGTTIGDILFGHLAFGDAVRIPVLIIGRDTAGHRHAVTVDVDAQRDWTIDQVYQAAQTTSVVIGYEMPQNVTEIYIMPGAYAI